MLELKVHSAQDELDNTQAKAGLAANGDYVKSAVAGSYIANVNTMKEADEMLELKVHSAQDELDVTQASAGLSATGTYVKSAVAGSYIANVNTMLEADEMLELKVHSAQDELDATQAGAGLTSAGAYADATSNYLKSTVDGIVSLKKADEKLDTIAKGIMDGTGFSTSSFSYDISQNLNKNFLGGATTLQSADVKLNDAIQVHDDVLNTASITALGKTGTGTDWSMVFGDSAKLNKSPGFFYNTTSDTLNVVHVTCNSDARKKTDIEEIKSPELLHSLRPVQYKWKEGISSDQRIKYGFIAQEVESVLPSIVNVDSKGDYSIAYIEIISILVKEVQKLRVEVDAIKSK